MGLRDRIGAGPLLGLQLLLGVGLGGQGVCPDPGGAEKAGPAWGWSLTQPALPSPSSSCFHGGTCVDGVNSFSCQCRPGYTGAHCQHEADPCVSRPCLHGGVCTAAHPGFRCTCPEGFTGAQCQVGVATGDLGEESGGAVLG